MQEIAVEPIFKVPFLPARAKLWRETAKQLYVLIGLNPVYSDKTIDGEQIEPYLCFRFDRRKKAYDKTRVLLKAFGIACRYENTDDAALIAIPEHMFPSVAALFSSDLSIVDWHTDPLPIDNFSSKERLALFNCFFSLHALDHFERRNNTQYDLRKVMLKMLDIVTQNLNAIDCLQEHGIAVTYRLNMRTPSSELQVEFESESEKPALLPAFVTMKKAESETVVNSSIANHLRVNEVPKL